MARFSVGCTIGSTLLDREKFTGVGHVVDVLNSVAPTTVVADAATVAANVATLVADGASPTQGHVNTLNTNWGTLNTDLAAMVAATGAIPSATDVVLSFNASTVITKTVLRRAVAAILLAIDGSDDLTP